MAKSEKEQNNKNDLIDIIIKPRITEKGAVLAEDSNAYAFVVRKDANKNDIKKAVKALYNVTPTKISIVRIPTKSVQVRGKRGKFGTKSGGKKAYVFLKKGERIEFV